eukprot:c19784_g1_i1 orf=77-352(+)
MGSQHFNYPPGIDCLPDLHKKWHPDKHNGEEFAKARFQEINEAYRVLIDPAKRLDYDSRVDFTVDLYSDIEYLDRFRGLILTCNGLGMGNT